MFAGLAWLAAWCRPRHRQGKGQHGANAWLAAAALLALLPGLSHAGATERVSVDSAGTQANSDSGPCALSADGRYVAIKSIASNLVAGGDTNGWDIFVHDRVTGATERVSVDSAGTQANNSSDYCTLSADGRYVAFRSYASNLVAGDTNGTYDVFVHDRVTGATERVSVDSAGTQANSGNDWPTLSADGRYVAFASLASNLVAGDTNGTYDVFVHDRVTGATERVNVDSAGTHANHHSYYTTLSADGRYVGFLSYASNLVAGDTNGTYDVFVHDRVTGATERVSVDSAGTQANSDSRFPTLSTDGRYVAFASLASNLVAGDTNGAYDVFVHDRVTGATERVNVDSAGTQANSGNDWPTLSADGRYVAFASLASNLVAGDGNSIWDIFVHDRVTGATERVNVDSAGTHANHHSYYTTLSADGRYVGFLSYASNLVAGDTNGTYDAFVHDRVTGATERVSVDSAGTQANSSSESVPTLSADGRYVAFASAASNLVAGDTNDAWDVFVHDRVTGATERVSVDSAGTQANSDTQYPNPTLSADGRYVAFASIASNLVAGDTNGTYDAFVHDRGPPEEQAPVRDDPVAITPTPVEGTPPTERSAVVITHGWHANADTWVFEMAKAVCSQLPGIPHYDEGPIPDDIAKICDTADWDVYALDWRSKAFSVVSPLPQWAYGNAPDLGRSLARSLRDTGYQHIHFIAHSAGANLIHNATTRLRALLPTITIHETFLDAYDPYMDPTSYGLGADWADNYVDTRDVIFAAGTLDGTKLFLNNAYSVDDTSYPPDGCALTGVIDVLSCRHGRPYRFYGLSIFPSSNSSTPPFVGDSDSAVFDPVDDTAGMGYPLSLEKGATLAALNSDYRKGRACKVDGNICYPYAPTSLPPTLWTFLPGAVEETLVDGVIGTGNFVIGTGTMLFNSIKLGVDWATSLSPLAAPLTTASVGEAASWIVVNATTTAPTNTLRFNWHFASAGEGFLRVFVDDVLVGQIDQRHVPLISPEPERMYVGELAPGVHKLAFRLDGFGTSASGVELTDVELGLGAVTTTTAANYGLNVVLAGTGVGTVASSPAGIDCGADCGESYASGTAITLTATAAAGSTFAGWTGTNATECATGTLFMDADKSCTATFDALPSYSLAITKVGTGAGTIASSPVGIDCGADCGESYLSGTAVALTATVAASSTFAGWTGTNATECATGTVLMDADKTCTATFDALPNYSLVITKVGTGAGTVASSPTGIDCGADCSESYASGTTITLTATAAAGSTFAGWTGTNATECATSTVIMSANKSCTATFALSVNVALATAGAVASASSTYSTGYPASALINNQRTGAVLGSGGVWRDATSGAFPDWVQINFSGTKTIDRAVVYTLQNNYTSPTEPTNTMTFSLYGVTGFTVQGWNGSAWITLATVTGNNLVKRTVTFAPFTTDRIRVNVTDALYSYSMLTEVEVWGVAAIPTPDTMPPTVPSGLVATAASSSQINLSWSAATDAVGVTAYKVYRGGSLMATLGNVTSYSNTGLTASTFYSYTVAACDAAANCSAQSAAASATTLAAGASYTLTMTKTGTGTIASSPTGINCGVDCSENYANGTTVVLTATAAAGSTFAGWTGANATECATGTVIMSANKSCTAAFALVRNTGFRAPTVNYRDSGGDGNGYETNPSYAYSTNGISAVDYNSGTTTSTSCTDSGKDKHRYYGFGFAMPTASTIKGLELRLKAKADSTSGSPKICVQVSWNGGVSWTTPKSTTTLGTTLATYALGAATDTWGRAWSASNFTNANFRVRVIDVSSSTARDFSLDSVAVNVSYY